VPSGHVQASYGGRGYRKRGGDRLSWVREHRGTGDVEAGSGGASSALLK
jgi:hypothetical protein